jgi:transcriptional regulator with XRE-family HTH domain
MIKKIRISKGWSQDQLAQFCGLNVRTIQRIERGHNAGLESLKSIAAVFDMDIAMLEEKDSEGEECFLGANPILPVSSVEDTAKFYRDFLGFDIDVLWNQPPYAVVARDKTTIEFGEGRKEFAGTGVCIIFVRDVNLVFEEYSSKNIEFLGDCADRDYGSRDFRIKDNNGNILIFSTPLINQKINLEAGNSAPKKLSK